MDRMGLDRIAKVIGAEYDPRCRAHAVTGASIDSRQTRAGDLFFALPGTRIDGAEFIETALGLGAGGAVAALDADLSGQDVPSSRILRVPDPGEALRTLAAHHRSTLSLPVVAVTGSCGKTTTREMIHKLLGASLGKGVRSKKSYNNELGVPLTLLEVNRSHAYAVVEMGANHSGEIRSLARIARPRVGLITNIRSAHLEGFGNLPGVARAKGELFEELPPDGLAVFNPAEFGTSAMARRLGLPLLTFGARPGCIVRIESVRDRVDGISVKLNGVAFEVPLIGARMAWNVAAAAAVGLSLGVELEQAARSMRTFQGPRGRLTCETIGALTLIDDAYNANPSSMRAALETARAKERKGRLIVVMGDMLELGRSSLKYHMELGREVAAAEPDLTVFVGTRVSATVGAMVARGIDPRTIHYFDDTDAASAAVPGFLEKGDLVLLKASRGLRFERIRETIETRFGAHVTTAP
ncbi:MAG: UDP-N-acetylmuramoyl-tripeptide--D-alanyl-D-alanine ligase [Planctomycetota bacterium]|jgi:UDP-N-acetylmuramoyl-tripeptide--D-alanyl-D-alanine ligase